MTAVLKTEYSVEATVISYYRSYNHFYYKHTLPLRKQYSFEQDVGANTRDILHDGYVGSLLSGK